MAHDKRRRMFRESMITLFVGRGAVVHSDGHRQGHGRGAAQVGAMKTTTTTTRHPRSCRCKCAAKAAERNFVAPPAPLATRQPVTIDAPAWMVQQQPQDLTRALEAADGAQERTSAMDRARALRVRLLPFVLLWALLAVIVFVVVLYGRAERTRRRPGGAAGVHGADGRHLLQAESHGLRLQPRGHGTPQG